MSGAIRNPAAIAAVVVLTVAPANAGKTILIQASRLDQVDVTRGPHNLWLPDGRTDFAVQSLAPPSVEQKALGLPLADTALKGVLLRFGVTQIRHRYEPSLYLAPRNGPLGPIDLSFFGQIYEIVAPSEAAAESLMDAVNALPRFYAGPPAIAVVPAALPNDPRWASQADYLGHVGTGANLLHLPRVWDVTKGDTAVIVGILDYPIRWTHQDFTGRRHVGYSGAGCCDHGTAVASIIGAMTNNGFGMAGIVWNVTLASQRVSGLLSSDDIENDLVGAYVAIIDDGAQITNHSYYWPSNHKDDVVGDPPRRKPYYYDAPHLCLVGFYNAGVVNVAAAGNYASDDICPPASLDESVIAFTANDVDGDPIPGISNGSWIDFTAQGIDIVAAYASNDTAFVDTFGGTSATSAHGAGLAALAVSYLKSIGEIADADDIRAFLTLGSSNRLPRLDSALQLVKGPANSLERYASTGGWTVASVRRISVVMQGITGLATGAYSAEERVLKRYIPLPEDYFAV